MAILCAVSDITCALMSGHAYSFKGKVPTEVPEAIASELQEAFPDIFEIELPALDLDTVLRDLINEGNMDNFKADGTPKMNIVISMLGKRISATEVYARYRELLNDGSGIN